MNPCKQSPLATACLAALAAFTLPALAGNADPSAAPDAASADTTTLATTVVTASRAPEQVDTSLATVSVIDRGQIQASQAHNLLELLRHQAGIDLARSGGHGSAISLFLRGTNSNHVLVLVDGVRVSSMNTGALDWSNLPLAQIERIEIVRGPRAAYWGSDAIGGVIQIFTRRLDGPVFAVHAGSQDTRRVQAGIGADNGQAHFSLVVGHDRSDGFSAQNEDGFNYWPDDDGYRQRSLGLTAGVA
ncbi:MAG: TonB-dependent receptor plug domain-containing protein, partial [Lysobacterales bacterium]